MKILWIDPVGTDQYCQAIGDFLSLAKASQTHIDVVSLRRGPLHLEYQYYEALILADTLHLVRKAERDGYDAAIIGCFYDPGLSEAREISERLVITAPAEATMHIATTLGHTFSIIVGRKKWIPKMQENVKRYGFEPRLASFKAIELGVRDFQKSKAETASRLRKAVQEAIEHDRAEVIILGCTMEFGFYKDLQTEFGVPVIDPVLASLKYSEFLVDLRERFNWSHSKICSYQSPPLEEIRNWRLNDQYGVPDLWE